MNRFLAGFTFLLAALSSPGAAQHRVKEGFAAGAGGVRLHYRLVGTGRDTILVIHGGPASGMREGYDLEALADQGHALLLYDQRGAGLSDLVAAPSELTLQHHVADLEALRRFFRLGRSPVIGMSWGAAIALHHAVTYPGASDHLVFLSPMPPTGLSFVARFARLDSMRTAETRARLRAIDSEWSNAPDSALAPLCRESARLAAQAYQVAEAPAMKPRGDSCDYPPATLRHRRLARIAAFTALGAGFNFTAALGRLRRPVLVIEGEESTASLADARSWARHAGNGRLLLVRQAGHRSWLDRPAVVLDAIHEFLQGDWPAESHQPEPE